MHTQALRGLFALRRPHFGVPVTAPHVRICTSPFDRTFPDNTFTLGFYSAAHILDFDVKQYHEL